MSTPFFKSKEKRPRTSSNETNTSFVKNVTSRVSGLLPSTITKWFSSPSSSNANGSVPTAEATDSSTEDEAPESPIVAQPPAKRMRFNMPNKLNQYGGTDVNFSSTNIEITEIPVTSFAGVQFPTNRNSVTTPIKNNESVTNEIIKEKIDMDTPRFGSSQHTISRIGQSVANKRKSIFDKSNNEDEVKGNKLTKLSPSDEKKPHFKPHLLGSPFYPGRTMYGGASSSYMNQANIQQRTTVLVNETKSNEDSIMSSSARRIMDLLESYSSPLSEARRIPQYIKPKSYTNKSTHRLAPYQNKSISYKTQELYVPSIASIMSLKQKSRLMDSTKTARQIIASHSSASTCPLAMLTETSNTTNVNNTREPNPPRSELEMEKSNKVTTKLKARVTRMDRGNHDLTDIATPVKLPSVTLQIDQNKLPKFTIDTPTATKLPATSTPKLVFSASKPVEIKNNVELPTSKPELITGSTIFKFSDPVKVSCDTFDTTNTSTSFTFDSPERHIDNVSQIPESSVVGKIEDTDKSVTNAKDWQCPDCWVNNKSNVTKCVCCGYIKAKLKKCALCKLADSVADKDICVNCDKMQNPLPEKSSKWKCDSCWVMNEANAVKCVCCNSTKPSDEFKAAKTKERDLIPKVKYSKCGGCFQVNGGETLNSKNKSKPFTVPSTMLDILKPNDENNLLNIAKAQKSNKWECYSCLVMNESDRSTCVCCGTEKETKSKLPEVKFNFGTNTNTTFKFGIDPKLQADTIAKKPEIKSTPDAKEQSETNNNNLVETPTYNFSLPTKKGETQIDLLKPKPVGTVKFSFGIPKDTSESENKSQQNNVVEEDKEKAQEVPQVIIPASVQDKPKLLGDSFTPQQDEKKNLLVATTMLFTSPLNQIKNNRPSESTVQPVTTSTEKSQFQNTFALGSSALKPTTNLFSVPITTSNTTNAFNTPQTIAVTTSAPTMSLIPAEQPKSDVMTSITTSATKPVIAASMFSFADNAPTNPSTTSASTLPTAVVTTDKPSFQFSFGSSNSIKADATPSLLAASNTQSVFNSPFGSSGEAAKNSTSFGFNAGTTLGTNNPISAVGGANGLSGTNGLSGSDRTGNTLGGSNLTGNTLSGNGLSTNILSGKTLTGNTFPSNNLTVGSNVPAVTTLGGINGLSGNTLTGGNSMQHDNTLNNNTLTSSTTNIFGNTVQKENMWNSSANSPPSTNLFVSNTTANSLPKPPAFSFTASTPFNSTNPAPTFGNNTQSGQNIFGMANQNNNQPSLFSNSVTNQNTPSMFGSPQPASNPTPQLGMFSTGNISTPTFGTANPSIPSFEAPSMTQTPAPAFNFGAPVQSTGVFGFGQQQAQQQPQQAGVYSFGGAPSGPPQVQFAMGTAPNTAGRRLRKAVRRATPR